MQKETEAAAGRGGPRGGQRRGPCEMKGVAIPLGAGPGWVRRTTGLDASDDWRQRNMLKSEGAM